MSPVATPRLASLPPLVVGGIAVEPIVLAPMAGVSELPFRVLALDEGAGLAPTELVSAKSLETGSARTEAYLRRDAARERPFVVQLFGGEPDALAEAARRAVDRGADVIDLNMGCPVPKITKRAAGSALLLDLPRAARIVEAMARASGRPISVKLRSGWDDTQVNAVEAARTLERAGAALIAVHGRTRAQGYGGFADWSIVGAVKRAVAVPVVVNGDIDGPEAAERALEASGADAIMVGRAALGRPWIFRAFRAARRGVDRGVEVGSAPPTAAERAAIVIRHFDAHLAHHTPKLRAIHKFRRHLLWYSRGLADHEAFRRAALTLEDEAPLRAMIAAYFASAEPTGEDDAAEYDARSALG
jgi:nifR3 family TIM-barrel protein